MRPVDRGNAPKPIYAKYQDAIGDLEGAIGSYCSYCERHFPSGLAVEHVIPKSLKPKLRTTWSNFLIACSNCNSVKNASSTNKSKYLWPDVDNTFNAFQYANGLATLTPKLNKTVQEKARKLLKLVGLDRHPGQPNKQDRPAKRDDRWKQREKIWKAATVFKKKLARNNNQEYRELIVFAATGYGFFSVWMAVFANDKRMRLLLIAAFTGTACFDKHGFPVQRGRI